MIRQGRSMTPTYLRSINRRDRHRWATMLRRLRQWTPRIDLRQMTAEEFSRAITGPIKWR